MCSCQLGLRPLSRLKMRLFANFVVRRCPLEKTLAFLSFTLPGGCGWSSAACCLVAVDLFTFLLVRGSIWYLLLGSYKPPFFPSIVLVIYRQGSGVACGSGVRGSDNRHYNCKNKWYPDFTTSKQCIWHMECFREKLFKNELDIPNVDYFLAICPGSFS